MMGWSSDWARTKAFLLQASGCQKKNCGERNWMSDLAASILDFRAFTKHIPSISYFVYFFLPIFEFGRFLVGSCVDFFGALARGGYIYTLDH